MNLHPYDGVERRFRHTDTEHEAGLAIVARLLGLPTLPPSHVILYDLSFYSGGIGVLDKLAITLRADQSIWASVSAALAARTPEQALHDPEWADDLAWLLFDDEQPAELGELAARFINQERRAFQTECHPASQILLAEGSGVNWWLALWGDDATLNYLSYDQG
jgi:hypothetical protein